METGARAEPDGYTILTAGTSQLVMNKFFYKSIPYDPVKDYAGVAVLADLPIALWVHTSVPVKSFPELLTYMKARPNELNYGSAGVGHLFHLGMELLEERTGVRAVHVPYKGVGPAVQDFLAGRIQLMFSVAQRQVMAQYRAGKVLPLVGGTDRRLQGLPDVPTFDEMGVPGMDLPNWVGLVVPAQTPKEIIDRLNAEMLKATASEIARKTYTGMAMEVVKSTPQQFEARYKRDIERWGPIIKKIGIEPS
jgi:tripartite-type tricarboxylate transporter receptor subunit TctC